MLAMIRYLDHWATTAPLISRYLNHKFNLIYVVVQCPPVGVVCKLGERDQLRCRPRHLTEVGLSYRSLGPYWLKTRVIDFRNLLLIPISYYSGSFAMREKGSNRLVPGPDYMEDALKLPNQAPRVSGESLQTSVAWHCPDGTQHLFCWPILAVSGQSPALNGPVVDSSDLNLVFGHVEATHNKLFFSSPTKYTVEPSWP
ncbi:hypothetical protein TNCV_1249051 [Trichonephila clavipes]|nr:hypothetical protein TNCV_1249051 [Trichonephila clavipes]